MRGIGKRFVYILRSETDPSRHYVGVTSNVDDRLDWHNGGPSGQTAMHRPWSVVVSRRVPADEQTAIRFEKYLKSGSGRAFAKKHFSPIPPPRGAGLSSPPSVPQLICYPQDRRPIQTYR